MKRTSCSQNVTWKHAIDHDMRVDISQDYNDLIDKVINNARELLAFKEKYKINSNRLEYSNPDQVTAEYYYDSCPFDSIIKCIEINSDEEEETPPKTHIKIYHDSDDTLTMNTLDESTLEIYVPKKLVPINEVEYSATEEVEDEETTVTVETDPKIEVLPGIEDSIIEEISDFDQVDDGNSQVPLTIPDMNKKPDEEYSQDLAELGMPTSPPYAPCSPAYSPLNLFEGVLL